MGLCTVHVTPYPHSHIYIYIYHLAGSNGNCPFPIGNTTINGRLSIATLDCQRIIYIYIYMLACSETGRLDTSSSPQFLERQHRP